MRKIKTLRFGEIEISEDKLLHFEQGLPGFENEHEFVLVIQDVNSPYAFLQSAETEELAFLMARPFVFFPDYEFVLSDTAEEQLGLKSEEDLDIFVMVTIPDRDVTKITVNLLAPVVINKRNQQAQQYVLEKTKYTVKQALFPEAGKEGR